MRDGSRVLCESLDSGRAVIGQTGNKDVRSFFQESRGRGKTDTACAADDETTLARKTIHGIHMKTIDLSSRHALFRARHPTCRCPVARTTAPRAVHIARRSTP